MEPTALLHTLMCMEYSRVCGKIIGYQQKSPDAFWPYFVNHAIGGARVYVDGISLTHG